MPAQMLIKPDLQTRESVMMAAGRVQFSVTTDEGVRYIKLEAKIKQPEGSAKRYLAATLDEATHVFISEKGYGTPRIGTYYPPNKGYDVGRFFEDNHADPRFVYALEQLINHINGASVDPAMEIKAESKCGLCGHKLEDPKSIERGIGPDCAGKPTGSKILHASKFGQQELTIPEQVDMEAVERLEAQATPVEVIEVQPPTFTDAELRLVAESVRERVREAGVELDEAPEYKAIVEKIDAYLLLTHGATF